MNGEPEGYKKYEKDDRQQDRDEPGRTIGVFRRGVRDAKCIDKGGGKGL